MSQKVNSLIRTDTPNKNVIEAKYRKQEEKKRKKEVSMSSRALF